MTEQTINSIINHPILGLTRISKPELKESNQLLLLSLTIDNRMISTDHIHSGKLEHELLAKKHIFKKALSNQATKILVIHFRSLQDSPLTPMDAIFFNNLKEICNIVKIQLLDFIIIEGYDYASLLETNLFLKEYKL